MQSRLCLFLAVLLVFGLYGLRAIHLDQDLPTWGVACYQPKDEGCYAILAINEMEYGSINPMNPLVEEESYPMLIQEHMRSNILGNCLNMLSFHLFGDNYYGLRMPMVLIGLLNLLLLGLVLLQLRKRYGQGTVAEMWGIVGLLFLTSMHFYYYISSRTVEPSTLRMLFAQLTVLIWLTLETRKRLCFFLMGACITASVFLVYITNVFLYLAVGLLLLFLWKQEGVRYFLKSTFWFAAGSLVVFVVAWIYYRQVWGSNPIENFFGAIGLFGGASGYEIAGGGLMGTARTLLKGAIKYFSSFWILYAPAVLAIVLALLPAMIYTIWKKKDGTLFFLWMVPASFLLQTMVSEDYIWRKILVVSPYFTYLIFCGCMQRNQFTDLGAQWDAWCLKQKHRWQSFLLQWIGRLYLPTCALVTAVMVFFHLKITNDLGKLDFTSIDKLLILVLGVLPILVWCGLVCWKQHQKHAIPISASLVLLGGSTLLLSLSMLTLHVWANPSYEERDMMISLSEGYDLDGKYVIGDYVMGITLYNDLRYVTDSHLNYAKRMIENESLLMFHYDADSQGMRGYLDTTIFSPLSCYAAEKVATIPGTLQVNGTIRDFALYRAEKREIVVSEVREQFMKAVLDVQAMQAQLEKSNAKCDGDELIALESEIKSELSALYDPYPDHYGDRQGNVLSPIYVDTYGSIYGDICAPIYGRVFGDVYGDIKVPVYGTIFGNVYGDVHPDAVDYVNGTIHERTEEFANNGQGDVEK